MLQHGHVNMQKNQLILTLGQNNQKVLKKLKKAINNNSRNISIVQKHLKINNDNLYHSSNNS
jgi:hypothetical protein